MFFCDKALECNGRSMIRTVNRLEEEDRLGRSDQFLLSCLGAFWLRVK